MEKNPALIQCGYIAPGAALSGLTGFLQKVGQLPLAAHGVERGDRVAIVLPPAPETAAIFFGTWKLGATMSVLYGDDSIRHRLEDSGAKLVVTDAVNAGRFGAAATGLLLLDEETFVGASTDPMLCDTSADDPAQLYYTSGTTGLAKGIVHAHRYILGHEDARAASGHVYENVGTCGRGDCRGRADSSDCNYEPPRFTSWSVS